MRLAGLLVAVLVLTGCGGTVQHRPTPIEPHLPSALAAPWRAQADGVAAALAAGDGCLARQRASQLQLAVIGAVNRHALAPRFQEPLLSAVNDLKDRITCTPPAPVAPPAPAPVSHGHGRGHEKPPKHHGHGKHGKK